MDKTLIYTLFPYPDIFVFMLGAMVGSFLNVVVYRLPVALLEMWPAESEIENEPIPASWGGRLRFAFHYWWSEWYWSFAYLGRDFWSEMKCGLQHLSLPPSHCPHCHTPIRAYDNIPILSWFILRGRCRQCKMPFSFRYALNEMICGFLFWGCWHISASLGEFLFLAVFISLLWAIFWIDFDHQLIFNVITYPGILLGIVYNCSNGSILNALIGMLVGYILLEAIVLLSIVAMGKEGMGGGDVKLAMLLGSWLGTQQLLVALAVAFLLGSVVGIGLLGLRRSSQPFPFGPALVLGGILSLSIGEFLWTWYINAVVPY